MWKYSVDQNMVRHASKNLSFAVVVSSSVVVNQSFYMIKICNSFNISSSNSHCVLTISLFLWLTIV